MRLSYVVHECNYAFMYVKLVKISVTHFVLFKYVTYADKF